MPDLAEISVMLPALDARGTEEQHGIMDGWPSGAPSRRVSTHSCSTSVVSWGFVLHEGLLTGHDPRDRAHMNRFVTSWGIVCHKGSDDAGVARAYVRTPAC